MNFHILVAKLKGETKKNPSKHQKHQNTKYLEIVTAKEILTLSVEDYKILLRKIKEDLKK